MLDLVWLIPALPLAGFLVLVTLGKRLGEPRAGWLATGAMAGSFAATVVVFAGLVSEPAEERHFVQTLFRWVPAGDLQVDAGFLVDPLSVTMALFVTGVGALIHLYSIGYMHGDPGYHRFFAYLNLFAFSMLVLVLGDNLLLTFLGWEGVGACSYLLISFWFSKEANASAGKKAFITNRVGDWGFMLATFLAFGAAGTLQYVTVEDGHVTGGLLEMAGEIAPVTVTAIVLLLFVGACGKSAQLPLFLWLPDAMAGPTPVSALIHAATMVTSGVYLMTRVAPLVATSYAWAPDVIAWVGAITALFAATIAIAQNDIKRVLAYSTISQLGYMFLAVGTGAYVAAIFHMVTHAFFKALLFLGAGSVIHGMHGEQDMRLMGGLRRLMPWTAATFIVGWLAIAGVPPLAGFWSKDEILLSAWDSGGSGKALCFVGLVTALLTAYYMSRQVFMVFEGEARYDTAEVHPHESPWLMRAPLVALAGLSVVGGVINLPVLADTLYLEHWLEPVLEGAALHVNASTGTKIGLAVVSIAIALAGIAIAVAVYIREALEPVEPEMLARGWYYDEGVTAFMGGPGRAGFDGVAAFDANIVDGAVNGVGTTVSGGGRVLRAIQTGFVRSYALGVAAGVVIVVGYFLTRVGF
jgi:NADH-quinone oxidoreductase subunit L